MGIIIILLLLLLRLLMLIMIYINMYIAPLKTEFTKCFDKGNQETQKDSISGYRRVTKLQRRARDEHQQHVEPEDFHIFLCELRIYIGQTRGD